MTSKRFSLLFGIVLFLSAPLIPAPAFAQDLSEEKIKEFEALVTEAAGFKRDGDHEAAIERFEAAAAINNHPRLQMEIASSHVALENCHEAESTYEDILDRDDIRDDLRDDIHQRLRSLRPCPEEGRLSIGCALTDGDVKLRLLREDGSPSREGLCPIIWTVTPGNYTVVAQGPGGATGEAEAVVRPGRTTEEFIEFEDDSSERPTWVPYAGYGALAAGAGFLTAAIVGDLGTASRSEALRAARDSGDAELTAQWVRHNESVQTRTTVFYVSGALFLVAGGGVLAWHFTGPTEPQTGELSWSVAASPTSARLLVRW